MRFELIDAVLERESDRLVAIKSVTNAEEYLGDHFPGFPVLPGVMMIETLVQAARQLLDDANSPRPWVLAEVRNIRYGNMVRPAQQLRVEVKRLKVDGDRHTFQGLGTVGDDKVVQGRFVMRQTLAT
jgi:3-hydroxyacyl-[acyl-carrier-protein] dehydratase